MNYYEEELEKAKNRLKKAKKSIDENCKQRRPMEEPKILRSGPPDEVELMRTQKGLDGD